MRREPRRAMPVSTFRCTWSGPSTSPDRTRRANASISARSCTSTGTEALGDDFVVRRAVVTAHD